MRDHRSTHHGLRGALIAATILTLMLTACTRMLAGTAQSAPPRTFPNLDQFAEVNDADYTKLQHWGNTVSFKAPNGILCSISGYFGMSCSAVPFALPEAGSDGPPEGCPSVGLVVSPTREADNTYRFFARDPQACTTRQPDQFKDLPANSKVSLLAHGITQYTCAADETLLACIDPAENHGFVLQPSDSWTF